MRSILLVPNTHRDPELEMTCLAARLLRQGGFDPFWRKGSLSRELAEKLSPWARETEHLSSMDLLLALGGDGTILGVAREAAQAELPILGVNLGKVGFMAELEREELSDLPGILGGTLTLERRMMQEVRVLRDGKTVFSDVALNDAVVTKGAASKIVDLEVSVDDVPLFSFAGDGAVAATPTGSTAYSMSAGGPIVEPAGENLIITPVCAFALHARSFVFSPERVVGLRVLGLRDRDAYLSVDGGDAVELREGDRVLVSRSALQTRLVRFKAHNFYEIMTQKLLRP